MRYLSTYIVLAACLACLVNAGVDLGPGGNQEPCPSSTPLRCDNSQCVADPSECPVNTCGGLTPFQCSDANKTCAISSIYCNCQGIICSDGSCKPSFSQCKILEGCSELYPKRCGDGSCQPYNSDCVNHTGPTCPSPLVKCMDGICRLPGSCEGIPYYGCVKYQCPDGHCADNWTQCLCANPAKNKCYDGTCVTVGTLCAIKAPQFVNPMNLTYTVSTSASTTISVVQTTNTGPSGNIATINFPANTLNNASASTNLVNVNGAPSSVSQNINTVGPGGVVTPAQVVSPAINVNIGNGQSNLNNGANLTFNNLQLPPALPVSSLCIASVADNGTATCVGGVPNSANSITSNVTHFSTYVVIKRPSCIDSGAENAQNFCNRQRWANGTIGFFCANEGKKFYMCWEAPNTASSSIMSCPTGTACPCCSTDECSASGTISPCRN